MFKCKILFGTYFVFSVSCMKHTKRAIQDGLVRLRDFVIYILRDIQIVLLLLYLTCSLIHLSSLLYIRM